MKQTIEVDVDFGALGKHECKIGYELQAALDVERATNTKHVTLLEQQLEEIKKGLTDSATVYANMLRGIIATPREFEHRAEQIATLEQQRWELVEVLKKYGKHTALCGLVGGYGYCNCGFDEALANAEKLK